MRNLLYDLRNFDLGPLAAITLAALAAVGDLVVIGWLLFG